MAKLANMLLPVRALVIAVIGVGLIAVPAHAKPAPAPTYAPSPSDVPPYDPATGTQTAAPSGAAVATSGWDAANAYVDRYFPTNTHPYIENGAQVSIEQEQQTIGYFYANQFGFNGGNVGYLGLQTHTWTDHDLGKGVVFSIWGAQTVDTSPCAAAGCVGIAGTEGGSFLSIRMPFNWIGGWSYELKLVRGHSGDVLNQRVDAFVKDLNHGVSYWLGAIGVPANWGGFQTTTYQWIEEYMGAPYASCSNVLRTSAVWGGVTWLATATSGLIGSNGQFTHISSGAGFCPNSNAYWLGNNADREVIGAYS